MVVALDIGEVLLGIRLAGVGLAIVSLVGLHIVGNLPAHGLVAWWKVLALHLILLQLEVLFALVSR